MEKILILESDWRKTPAALPSQAHKASALYAAAFRHSPFTVRCRDLRAATLLRECREFLCLPENQRGVNLLLFSTHGEFLASGQRALAASDQIIVLETMLHSLQPCLSRSVLALDACEVGQALPQLCQQFGVLGVVGFAAQVNWTASSAFVLSWLRQCLAAQVWHLRRASSRRPARVLSTMQTGDYAKLMQQLSVQAAWKHDILPL